MKRAILCSPLLIVCLVLASCVTDPARRGVFCRGDGCVLVTPTALSPEQEARAPDWQNPKVFERNREPARATFFAFESAALARANDPARSQLYQSLNGQWRFKWVSRPADRPTAFLSSLY